MSSDRVLVGRVDNAYITCQHDYFRADGSNLITLIKIFFRVLKKESQGECDHFSITFKQFLNIS